MKSQANKGSNQLSNQLIIDNTKLIYYVMRKLSIQPYHRLYEDLYSAGMEGLVKAARTFKAKQGGFANHAFLLIRKQIQMVLNELTEAVSYGSYDTLCTGRDKSCSIDLIDPTSYAPNNNPCSELIKKEDAEIFEMIKKIDNEELLWWTYFHDFGNSTISNYIRALLHKYHPNISTGKGHCTLSRDIIIRTNLRQKYYHRAVLLCKKNKKIQESLLDRFGEAKMRRIYKPK